MRRLAVAAGAAVVIAMPAAAQTRVVSGHVPLCMSVAENSKAMGAAIVTWYCVGGADEQIVLTAASELRVYGDHCIDAGVGNDGDAVTTAPCNMSPGQRWRANGNRIVSGRGRCLDIKNASVLPWGAVTLSRCSSATSQTWAALSVSGVVNAVNWEDLAKLRALSAKVSTLGTRDAEAIIPVGSTTLRIALLGGR